MMRLLVLVCVLLVVSADAAAHRKPPEPPKPPKREVVDPHAPWVGPQETWYLWQVSPVLLKWRDLGSFGSRWECEEVRLDVQRTRPASRFECRSERGGG